MLSGFSLPIKNELRKYMIRGVNKTYETVATDPLWSVVKSEIIEVHNQLCCLMYSLFLCFYCVWSRVFSELLYNALKCQEIISQILTQTVHIWFLS